MKDQNPYPFWYKTLTGWKYIENYVDDMRADDEYQQFRRYILDQKEEARRRARTEYMMNKEWRCEVCNNRDYKLAGKHSHLKTKKHQNGLKK